MIKEITKKYNTVSQLIAHEGNDNIAICNDGKNFYVHERNQIYDFVNPMSPYKRAFITDGILCIVL
jgi:hypothetical protein